MPNRRNYDVTIPGVQTSWNYVTGKTTNTPMSSARAAYRFATDYSRRKPTGRWVPPTNYSMTEITDIRAHGKSERFRVSDSFRESYNEGCLNNANFYSDFGGIPNKYGISEGFPSDIANQALIKARTKLKNQNINLALAYAEHAQTAGLVASNLRRIAKMGQAVLDRDWRALEKYFGNERVISRIAKDVPSAWLELQYGWRPLLSDIHGAVTALDQKDVTDWMVTVTGKASRRLGGEMYNSGSGILSNYKGSAKMLHSSFVRIDAYPSSSALKTGAACGLTNPATILWEKTPFSFVVDWAWPLGSYFNQMDSLMGWEIRGFSQSNLSKGDYEASGRNFVTSDGLYRYTQDWRARRRYVSVARSAGMAVPFPFLPGLKNPASGTHVLNALALMSSVFKNGKAFVR